MKKSLLEKIKLLKPIFQLHKVEKAYLFGSATNANFSEQSDIDLLITFQENIELY